MLPCVPIPTAPPFPTTFPRSPAAADWRASHKWYVRVGMFLARTLVMTWLYWIALVTAVAILWLIFDSLSQTD